MSEEQMSIFIYRDMTGLFTEAEVEHNNMCEMLFPAWLLKEWYDSHAHLREATAERLKKPVGKCTYTDWVDLASTADDTEGLFAYALEKGCRPEFFGKDVPCFIYRENRWGEKKVIYKGLYTDCRYFGRAHKWKWYSMVRENMGLVEEDPTQFTP